MTFQHEKVWVSCDHALAATFDGRRKTLVIVRISADARDLILAGNHACQ